MYKLKIKEIRKSRGLTQKKLAYKVGISQNFLSELENGKYDICLSLIAKLGFALDVDPHSLIEFHSNRDNFF